MTKVRGQSSKFYWGIGVTLTVLLCHASPAPAPTPVASHEAKSKATSAPAPAKSSQATKPAQPTTPVPKTAVQRRSFDDAAFAEQQLKSQQLMIQNLNSPGIRAGVIIASPSQVDPNYFYHWIRDAAISFMEIQSIYARSSGTSKTAMQTWMLAHMKLNLDFQAMQNLIAGDGEPKFNVDGSAYQLPWGRPQTDGPALRAISFMYLYGTVAKENWTNQAQILAQLYDAKLPTKSLIKTDLEYVANHWMQNTFDLWEEANGAHFFTLMMQRRAMIQGAALANSLGDSGASQFYAQQALKIASVLQNFYNVKANYILTSMNLISGPPKQTLLDSSVLLAALYGDVGDGFYAPYDDRILATLQAMKDVFQKIYAINQNSDTGTAFGRYPEDTYNGVNTNGIGNPWFISTQAAAEIYYRAAFHVSQVRQIQINATNIHFYNSLMAGQMTFTIGQVVVSPAAMKVAEALFNAGDLELERTILHRGPDGSLSEQINRGTGRMQGAVNLTWSHASYLDAYFWRSVIRSQF